jgi:solute carrier family 25, member 34/35
MPTINEHFVSFWVGAFAACGAVTITNPMEIIKTRLQLQGELSKSGTRITPMQAFLTIYRDEGIKGLQKGLLPAYGYQILLNGFRLGMYETLAKNLQTSLDTVTQNPGSLSAVPKVSAGAISGVIGAFVASPLFLVKTVSTAYSSECSRFLKARLPRSVINTQT